MTFYVIISAYHSLTFGAKSKQPEWAVFNYKGIFKRYFIYPGFRHTEIVRKKLKYGHTSMKKLPSLENTLVLGKQPEDNGVQRMFFTIDGLRFAASLSYLYSLKKHLPFHRRALYELPDDRENLLKIKLENIRLIAPERFLKAFEDFIRSMKKKRAASYTDLYTPEILEVQYYGLPGLMWQTTV